MLWVGTAPPYISSPPALCVCREPGTGWGGECGSREGPAVIGGMDVLEPGPKANKCLRAGGERQCVCPDLSALEVGSSVVHSGRL